MRDDFVPPIFLISDDVASFDSIDAMVQFVEPWDVDDEMQAFDSRGRLLKLRAMGVKRTRFTVGGGETFVDFDASGDVAPDEVAVRLRDYVQQVGIERFGVSEAEIANAPLERLVVLVHPVARVR